MIRLWRVDYYDGSADIPHVTQWGNTRKKAMQGLSEQERELSVKQVLIPTTPSALAGWLNRETC